MNTTQFTILLALSLAFAACDSKDTAESSPAEATAPEERGQPEPGEQEPKLPDPVESEDDHDGEVHLGEHMYELSRRFAAVWYGGKAGNVEMVDYQLHEMHEVIEEIESAQVVENGVDVGGRLKSDVEAHFDALEKAVEDEDTKRFETLYTQMAARCTNCHLETDHGFLKVKKPDYNPYPNLEF